MTEAVIYQIFSWLMRLMIPVISAVIVSSLFSALISKIFRVEEPAIGFVINFVIIIATLFLFASFYQESLLAYGSSIWANSELYR
ncbi:MAG: hypothetical protein IT292_01750 [Deltaproteobacteria bacterium]|nr:hypothetical protein [Deltaproteobacteria bacterium]